METRDLGERIAAAKREIRARSLDGVQRRTVQFLDVEVRSTADGDGFTLRGHAAVFDDLSENLGGFRERIEPGAFDRVLAGKPDVRALFNHDPNLILARTPDTLRLSVDERGLVYEADVAPTSYGLDLRILLDRGIVTQSSFAFRLASGGDTWDEDEDGRLVRTITEFSELYDVSPVTYPAYPTTDVGRSSSAPDAERDGDGPSAGERTDDGGDVDEQAGREASLSREFVARDIAARAALLRG